MIQFLLFMLFSIVNFARNYGKESHLTIDSSVVISISPKNAIPSVVPTMAFRTTLSPSSKHNPTLPPSAMPKSSLNPTSKPARKPSCYPSQGPTNLPVKQKLPSTRPSSHPSTNAPSVTIVVLPTYSLL